MGATPEASPYWGQEKLTLAMIAIPLSWFVIVIVFEPLAMPTYVLENDRELGLDVTSCADATVLIAIKPRKMHKITGDKIWRILAFMSSLMDENPNVDND